MLNYKVFTFLFLTLGFVLIEMPDLIKAPKESGSESDSDGLDYENMNQNYVYHPNSFYDRHKYRDDDGYDTEEYRQKDDSDDGDDDGKDDYDTISEAASVESNLPSINSNLVTGLSLGGSYYSYDD